jgi:NADPH:quinone reductase-like Zn-dependent oxidoreductase
LKAACFHRHGGPEVLEIGELPDPTPGPGEVLVAVRMAALNHLDVWLRRGLPTLRVPLPHVPGADACGVVEGLGPGVQGLAEGTRVVVNPGISCGRCARCLSGEDNLCRHYQLIGEQRWGAQAERLVVPAVNVVPAPDGVSDEALAALPTAYLTAWQMLVDKARIEQGESVVVLGAGSGVGVAAIQIARLFGARVLAVAGSAEKLVRARALGAEVGIHATSGDLVAAIKTATGGRGADVVFEHTGAATFASAVKACAKGGRIVTCGATSGYEATLDLRYVFWRQLSILGSTMAPKGRLFGLVELVREGKLAPVVDEVLPLEAVAEGHRRLEERRVFGKILLRVSP